MIYILTPEEVRKADQKAIDEYNIPATILMENAARSAAEFIKSLLGYETHSPSKIAVFCGVGNNGGDGFALARHLVDYEEIYVYWIGDPQKMSIETKLNFDILSNLNVTLEHITKQEQIQSIDDDFEIIIDALIGVGGSENLKGLVVDLLEKIESIRGIRIAIDVPTGLNSASGLVHPNAFKADYTVTMFAVKTGMVLGKAPDYCGNIVVGKLGAPQSIVEELCKSYIIEKNDVLTNLPTRLRESSKFDYGKVQIIAGSVRMPGAATLVANSAIKAGAGLVYLHSTKFHPQLLPEVIPTELPPNSEGSLTANSIDEILEFSKNMNVIAIGPGMLLNDDTKKIVKEVVSKRNKDIPVILDADALSHNLTKFKLDKNLLLTPHIGEFARVIGVPREEISTNPLHYAKLWAKKLNCNILLKGPTTIITNGDVTFFNTYGNPALATAGSGDVLTGIIASLIAQGCDVLSAATLGAYFHSKIGDDYAIKYASRGLTASKMIDLIEITYNELEKEPEH